MRNLVRRELYRAKGSLMSNARHSSFLKIALIPSLLCLCSWVESPGQTSSPPLQIKDRKKQSSAEQKALAEDINNLEEDVANLLKSLEEYAENKESASVEKNGELQPVSKSKTDEPQFLAKTPSPSEKTSAGKKPRKITPSARGCPEEDGLKIIGEFLYWRAFEDNLLVAANETTSGPSDSTSQNTTLITLQPSFKPGFRVGAGYNATYDDWWVDAIYTWYQTRTRVSATNPNVLMNNNPGIVSLIFADPIGGTVVFAGFVDSRWKLHYNVIDLELGRNFYISKNLSLNPFASIRGSWMRQSIHSSAVGITQSQFILFTPSIATSSQKQTFWGVGPRLGLNTHWLFGNSGVGFFLNGSASLLYAGFSYDNFTSFQNTEAPFKLVEEFSHTSYKRINANAELFLGFDYGHCWKDEALFLNVYAGYSATYWWGQNRMFTSNNLYSAGDLIFHGLTLGFDFEF